MVKLKVKEIICVGYLQMCIVEVQQNRFNSNGRVIKRPFRRTTDNISWNCSYTSALNYSRKTLLVLCILREYYPITIYYLYICRWGILLIICYCNTYRFNYYVILNFPRTFSSNYHLKDSRNTTMLFCQLILLVEE